MLTEDAILKRMQDQTDLINRIKEARQAFVTAQVELEDAKQMHQRSMIPLMLETADIVGQPVDPRTNRANKDWTEMLMQQELDRNENFLRIENILRTAQREFDSRKVALLDLEDELRLALSHNQLIASVRRD